MNGINNNIGRETPTKISGRSVQGRVKTQLKWWKWKNPHSVLKYSV